MLLGRRRVVVAEVRVDAGHPVDHDAVLVGGEVAGVLAGEAVPVVAAGDVMVRDADDRPDLRDLVGVLGVQTQRPSPGLHHRGGGGDRGQVDERGDARGVPALAEQPAGADEALRATEREVGRHVCHPRSAAPAPLEPGHRAVGDHPQVAREHRVGLAEPGQEALEALDAAGHGAAGDQHRVEAGGDGVGEQGCEHPRGRARRLWRRLVVVGVADAGAARRGRALVVAQHQHTSPLAQVGQLGADDAADGGLLGPGPRGDPVDDALADAHAATGPHVADRGERRGDCTQRPSVTLGVGAIGAAVLRAAPRAVALAGREHALPQPVVDHPAPVGRGRCLAVALLQRRAEGQLDELGLREPQHGVAQLRLAGRQLLPGGVGAERVVEALPQPRRQRRGGELGVEEVAGELGEALALRREPLRLLGGRADDPGQLRVRRQHAVLDQRRDPRLVEHRAKEVLDELRLGLGDRARRSGREPEHRRLGQQRQHLAQ